MGVNMPLHIINDDITKIKCDVIVNAANNTLLGGGGVDGAIHKAAGIALYKECYTLGGCNTGDAKITKGYGLPSRFVIHTVGPVWHGGQRGEKKLLESCYRKSLELAKQHACTSIAFPLISSGAYGYPKDKALSVAVKTISEFLFYNEMTVYIVVFDKASYQIREKLCDDLSKYIDNNYLDESLGFQTKSQYYNLCCIVPDEDARCCMFSDEEIKQMLGKTPSKLMEMLSKIDDNFAVTLLKLIDVKGITDVECYKKANVSKQTWYKIMNEKDYKPSKNTVISFAIALELSLEETKHLLSTVGFTLSKSSKFDIIIEYFLLNEEYNIFTINEILFAFDQVCLGS